MMHEPDVLHALVMDRISTLIRDRQWYRTHRWADWPDLRRETEVELRALLRLARQARRSARPAAFAGWDGWVEAEKAGAMGR